MNLAAGREQIYAALFAYLAAIPGIKTCTRKLKHWNDTALEDQPSLYMEHSGEVTQQVRGQPSRHVLELNLWLYVQTDGDTVGPILNPMLDAITNAFEPTNTVEHTMTLGGLVHHCWIEGQTQIFEGNMGNEAVAIIPVKLLVT